MADVTLTAQYLKVEANAAYVAVPDKIQLSYADLEVKNVDDSNVIISSVKLDGGSDISGDVVGGARDFRVTYPDWDNMTDAAKRAAVTTMFPTQTYPVTIDSSAVALVGNSSGNSVKLITKSYGKKVGTPQVSGPNAVEFQVSVGSGYSTDLGYVKPWTDDGTQSFNGTPIDLSTT